MNTMANILFVAVHSGGWPLYEYDEGFGYNKKAIQMTAHHVPWEHLVGKNRSKIISVPSERMVAMYKI